MTDRPARLYLGVAFGFSWTVGLVLWLTGGIDDRLRHVVGGFAFMCGPALGAVLTWRRYRLPTADLGLAVQRPRWLVVAWLVALALVLGATLLSVALPGVHVRSPAAALAEVLVVFHAPPEKIAKLARVPAPLLSVGLTVQACLLGPALNLPMMLSEELGWRGALWSRWSELPFWRRAWLLGFVWGAWHAPLIAQGHNYPGHPLAGCAMMIAFCMLLCPVLHHLRERGGSVWHACMFHGTINATATLSALCVTGGSPLWRGVPGAAGLVVLVVSTGLVWRARRG